MRKPLRRRSLSMTSLIDVIFLLLMFFMLASSFSRMTELPIAARGAGGAAAPESKLVFLKLGPERISLNGKAVGLEALEAALRDGFAQTPPRLLVSLAPDTSSQRLADLLVRLRAVPGLQAEVLG
ncbi:outer membrane transport energization protein ExbD [Thioclava sp. ES.031]|uniref:ExbD/TolR family protein n=1 Tax=Thioclava sp. ES.031 TaxID=1798203 RepID=UPI000C00ACFB|nr:biopolymer transporter ExbD [Thioclava sp. ES.031]PFG63917.1 outer membrane transport energization protein ExbD [Thioclava sp. ES.031]